MKLFEFFSLKFKPKTLKPNLKCLNSFLNVGKSLALFFTQILSKLLKLFDLVKKIKLGFGFLWPKIVDFQNCLNSFLVHIYCDPKYMFVANFV